MMKIRVKFPDWAKTGAQGSKSPICGLPLPEYRIKLGEVAWK